MRGGAVTEDQITLANGILVGIRVIGSLGSSLIGSCFYTAGGAPAPMIFSTCTFIVIYVFFTFVQLPRLPSSLRPAALPHQATALTVLRVTHTWPIIFGSTVIVCLHAAPTQTLSVP